MPRKKIIDAEAAKFSVDVSGDNKKILDKLTTNYNCKYVPMFNKIIATFCRMPEKNRKVIENTCLKQYEKITAQITHMEEGYHRKQLEEEKETYKEILRLLNGGVFEIEEEKPKMTKIVMQDSYLVIPNEWIVVNPEDAKQCSNAIVVECLNSTKYGVPHFIYLSDQKYDGDFEDTKEIIFRLCTEKWPKFSEILEINRRNKLVADPEIKGEFLNEEAYLQSPIVGLFNINEQGNGDTPYGAMIIRTDMS